MSQRQSQSQEAGLEATSVLAPRAARGACSDFPAAHCRAEQSCSASGHQHPGFGQASLATGSFVPSPSLAGSGGCKPQASNPVGVWCWAWCLCAAPEGLTVQNLYIFWPHCTAWQLPTASSACSHSYRTCFSWRGVAGSSSSLQTRLNCRAL